MNIKKHSFFIISCIAYILLVKLTGLNWFYFCVLAIADHYYWHYINWKFWKKRKKEKKKNVQYLRMVNAITSAVIGATLIHTFIIQPFTIPTSSMEKSMLIGDYLLANLVMVLMFLTHPYRSHLCIMSYWVLITNRLTLNLFNLIQ